MSKKESPEWLHKVESMLAETKEHREKQNEMMKGFADGLVQGRLNKLRTERANENQNDDRDLFIYEKACSLIKWSAIKREVERVFNESMTIEGVKKAADRYAKRKMVPLPPRRQTRGRPKKS